MDKTLHEIKFCHHYLPKTHLCYWSRMCCSPLRCWTLSRTRVNLKPWLIWTERVWRDWHIHEPVEMSAIPVVWKTHFARVSSSSTPLQFSPRARLWESSYHCLPGLGFGCRARVIRGSLSWDAWSLIRFFFNADDREESTWFDICVVPEFWFD